MSEWVFYSPSGRSPSVGDLLRAIPSRRNLRIERRIEIGAETTMEAVRAAERVIGLDAHLRLANDPTGTLSLSVDVMGERDRSDYRSLSCEGPAADEIAVRAEVVMGEEALRSGHYGLADDVVAGLESVLPGGVAYDRTNAACVAGREMVASLDADASVFSHVDARYLARGIQLDYLHHLLEALPAALGELVSTGEDYVALRGRTGSRTDAELAELRGVLERCAEFSEGGFLRVRSAGIWNDVVKIGPPARPVPDGWRPERRRLNPLGGALARLFKR